MTTNKTTFRLSEQVHLYVMVEPSALISL